MSIVLTALVAGAAVTKKELKRFAADNGFKFSSVSDGDDTHIKLGKTTVHDMAVANALPFNIGVFNVVTGNIGDFPMVLYHSSSALISSRMSRVLTLSIVLPRFLPTLVVEAKHHLTPLLDLNMLNQFLDEPMQSITLEGNFSNKVKVYTEKGHRVEALTIMSPDFMQLAETITQHANIVIFRDCLSLNTAYNSDGQTYQQLITIAQQVVERLSDELQNIKVSDMNTAEGRAATYEDKAAPRKRRSLLVGLGSITVGSFALAVILDNNFLLYIWLCSMLLWVIVGPLILWLWLMDRKQARS